MSEELLPCPVCGGEDFWHTVGDVIQCDTGGCTFACSEAYWTDWPRWVSVDDRLPEVNDDAYFTVIRHSKRTGGWFSKPKGKGSRAFGFGTTHWLDGIPSVPDA